MAYEKCPNCGASKHQLNACRSCGFAKRSLLQTGLGSSHKRRKNKETKRSLNTDRQLSKKSQRQPQAGDTESVKCQQCNRSFAKASNLKKHVNREHVEKRKPRIKVAKKKPRSWTDYSGHRPSREDAQELLVAMKETSLLPNEIKEFLKNNPSKDGIGKFGVPQDKYRWNFYGSGSMVYDSWRKNGK